MVIIQASTTKGIHMTQRLQPTTPDSYICGGCLRKIGDLVDLDGKTYLKIGNSYLYSYHGFCDCEWQIHFDSSEMILQRIIRRKSLRTQFDT